MDIKVQAIKNAAAAQQAAAGPSGCKSCQRRGVPILPLRVAVMPNHTVRTDGYSAVPKQSVALSGGAFKYGLRTLRMGYLYVLLDNSIWEGYEVTAEGYLRYFHPRKNPEKLKWLSSYINRLTEEYKCPVMAVPVDDAVGVVQELNIGRLMLLEETNGYLEQPSVFHRHMISEAITWYLGVLKKGIGVLFGQPGCGKQIGYDS